MQLRELKEGNRFMFVDQQTPLFLSRQAGSYTPIGTFRLLNLQTFPMIEHEEAGKRIEVVPGTYQRYVIPIFYFKG